LQQNSSRTATNTSVRKIPVTTGVKTDREVEIIQGLEEGDQIILKKVSSVSGGGQAPAITSLFRPGNQNNQTRQTGQTRAQ
jgi:hypothetical protein